MANENTSPPQSPSESVRKQRKLETAEERSERLTLEVQQKQRAQAEDDAAVDRMIKDNIARYGP